MITSPSQLIASHALLAKRVKPATPGSLSLLQKQEMSAKRFKWLGRTRLIQGLSIASVAAIILLVIILAANNFARMDLSNFAEATTLVLVSYIGASFLLLYQANENAIKGTYDPKYGSTYFIRVLLGMISGVLLAEILPLASNQNSGEPVSDVPKVVLALVGGFSVNVVYRILVRLSETVESLFQGDMQTLISSQIESNRLEQLSQSIEMRQGIATRLTRLSAQVSDQKQKDDIEDLINQVLKGEPIPVKSTDSSTHGPSSSSQGS